MAFARTPNAKRIVFEGMIWQKKKDAEGPYFEAVDTVTNDPSEPDLEEPFVVARSYIQSHFDD